MLQKCANPTCTVPFRSLREGKLFLAETFPSDLNSAFNGNRRKLRRREHFWLRDVARRLPYPRVHDDRGLDPDDVIPPPDHVVPPAVADVLLQLGAHGAEVEEPVDPAVDLGGLEDESAALAQRHDRFH